MIPLRRPRSRPRTGEPSWIRTSDLLIKSQLLYQLSYGPTARAVSAREPCRASDALVDARRFGSSAHESPVESLRCTSARASAARCGCGYSSGSGCFSEGARPAVDAIVHRSEVHQTTPYTAEDRYPELIRSCRGALSRCRANPVVRLLDRGGAGGPSAAISLRRRSSARRSTRSIAPDRRAPRRWRSANMVLPPSKIEGTFDIIFALAVLQRDPHRVARWAWTICPAIIRSSDSTLPIEACVDRLEPGGLLCVDPRALSGRAAAFCKFEAIAYSP